jgi:hypothetical protein
LPEIFDFVGKPSYPESRGDARRSVQPWIPDRKARKCEPVGLALA